MRPSDAKRPEYRRRWIENHPQQYRRSSQRTQNRKRDERRTAGLCPLCGMEPSVGCLYCDDHLEVNRERMRRRRAARHRVREIMKTPTIRGEKEI